MTRLSQITLGLFLLLVPPPSSARDPGLPGLTESERIENAVSLKLAEVLQAHQKEKLQQLDRRMDDVARLAALPPERVRLLRIGVQGFIERQSDEIARQMLGVTQYRLREPGPAFNAQAILAQDDTLPNDIPVSVDNSAWKQMLADLLSPAEFNKWEAAVAARLDCRVRAVTELVLLQLQPVVGFSEDEADKLLPLVKNAVAEYLPDFVEMFNSGDGEPNVYMPATHVLAHFADEAAVTAILGPERWTLWKTTAGQRTGNWNFIQAHHVERRRHEKQ